MRSHITFRFATMLHVLAVSIVLMASAPTPTLAATIEIEFTGMDLVYDGFSIFDAGSPLGGLADPANADPLTSAIFSVDGNPVGEFSQIDGDSISLDVNIPDVTGIPIGPGAFNLTTIGNPGFFDLLIGSPVATESLLLDLNEVTITYVDIANTVRFVFGAAVADTFASDLPFGLQIGDPVEVTFTANIASGSVTSVGNFVTGFSASGPGKITGTAVPEPSTCLLAAMGVIAGLVVRRWNNRR